MTPPPPAIGTTPAPDHMGHKRRLLATIAGTPLLLAGAPVGAVPPPDYPLAPGYFCTSDPQVPAIVETGSSRPYVFFTDAVGTTPGAPRTCFESDWDYYGSQLYLDAFLHEWTTTVTHWLGAAPQLLLEGDAGSRPQRFVVARRGAIYQPSEVALTLSGSAEIGTDTAPADATTTLAFAAMETTRTLTIDLLGDTEEEDDEAISVTISSPQTVEGYSASIPDPESRRVIILDDDRVPTKIAEKYICSTYISVPSGSSYPYYYYGVYVSPDLDPADGAVIGCGYDPYMDPNDIVSIATIIQPSPPPPTPAAPIIDAITPLDGALLVHFTGSGQMTAICSPAGGGASTLASGSSSPIRVDALVNGTSYSCRLMRSGVVSAPVQATPMAAAAPTASEPSSIPTLGGWLLILLSGLITSLGLAASNPRRQGK